MKNEQQSQNLLLKVDPRSTFGNNFLQPAIKDQRTFLLRDKLITQGEKRDSRVGRWPADSLLLTCRLLHTCRLF